MIKLNNQNRKRENTLTGVEFYEGESLMKALRRKLQNGEQIPIIMDSAYTEKNVGVLEAYNVRSDRFEIGQREAARIGAYKAAKKKKMTGGGEPQTVENLNGDK